MNILVIPDSHANPDTSNDRFLWLGRFILDRQPDLIVNLGDLFDMNSLSSYDKGKKSFEGRRYKLDIDVGVDALQKMEQPWNDFNNKRRNIRKARLKSPRKIITLGNHCHRIVRAVEDSPQLDGVLSLDNLDYRNLDMRFILLSSPLIFMAFGLIIFFLAVYWDNLFRVLTSLLQ